MHVDETRLLDISRELWEARLGLNLAPEPVDQSIEDRILASSIRVSGPWQGTILFECPESVAKHAAVMLFEADGESTTDDEIRDALNELADMIGKKMRTLLPEASKLSRASLVDDDDRAGTLAALQELSDLRLSCEGRPVRIALLDEQPEPVIAA